MLRKLIFVFILVAFKSSTSRAQCCGSNQLMVQQITASTFTNYYARYDGSPFFNDKWYNASIKLSGGEIYHGLKVSVDVFKDELIYENSTLNKYLIIDKSIINEIYLKNEKGEQAFLIKNTPIKGAKNQLDYSFYFIHVSDHISLWSKQTKVVAKSDNASARKLGYFYTHVKYYMIVDGNQTSVPLKKRSLAKMFPENKLAIISYVNQNQLMLKDINDLSYLFEEINKLETQKPSNYNR